MKKLIIAVSLMLVSLSTFAQFAISGDSGLESNYVYRNVRLSESPSANARVAMFVAYNKAAVFVNGDFHTLSFSSSDKLASHVNSLFNVEGGVSYALPIVGTVRGGVRQHEFAGGQSITGVKPINLSYREVFVGNSVSLYGGTLATDFAHVVVNPVVSNLADKDSYLRVAYTHAAPYISNLTLGIAGEGNYIKKEVKPSSLSNFDSSCLEVNATYNLTKNLDVYAIESRGHKNYFTAGATYKF
jgi:hypothetical protein